jgi:predicted protein tyrosine phosphatase
MRFLRRCKGEWDVISIRDPGDTFDALDASNFNVLPLSFSDIWDDFTVVGGAEMPQRDHVERALEFAKGKDRLLVHCNGGVSRSSAIAFLVACQEWDLNRALSILNFNLHWPNQRVIELGTEILSDLSIQTKLFLSMEKEVERLREVNKFLSTDIFRVGVL